VVERKDMSQYEPASVRGEVLRLSDISKNIESYLNQTGLKYDSYIIRSIEHWEDKAVGGDLVYDIFVASVDAVAKDAKGLIEFTCRVELSIGRNGDLIHFQLIPQPRLF